MAIMFPPPPVADGTVFGRWTFNLAQNAWLPTNPGGVAMLPIAGGTLTGPGNLTVNGTTTLMGATTAGAVQATSATVTGASTLANVTASGTLGVTGNATFAADVTATGDITCNHLTTTGTSLDIAGGAHVAGDVYLATGAGDEVFIGNDETAAPATGGNLHVFGDTTVDDDLSIGGDAEFAGLVTLAADPAANLEAATKQYVDQFAGGKKSATLVVGNAALHTEHEVDYLCDGTNDVAMIQQAIDDLPPQGGKIAIREGDYNLDGTINVHTKTEVFIEGMGDATNFNLLDMPGANNTVSYFEITTNAIFEHFHCTFTNQTQSDADRVQAVFTASGGMFSRFNYINFSGSNLTVNISYVFRNININDWNWGVRNDWTVFEVFKCNLNFDNVANHIFGAATIAVIGYFYIVFPTNPNVVVRRGIRGVLKECVVKVKNNNEVTGGFRLAMNYSFNTWIENNYFEIDRTSASLVSVGGGNPSYETHTVGNTIMCGEMHNINGDNIIGWGSGASMRHAHFMNNYIVVQNMYNCSGGLIYMNGGIWARDNFISVVVRTIGTRGAMVVFITAGTYSGSTFDNNRIVISRDDTTEPIDFPRAFFSSTNQSWATVQNVTVINNMINYNVAGTDPWYLWADRSNSGFAHLIEPGGPGVQGNILAWNRSGLFAFTRF